MRGCRTGQEFVPGVVEGGVRVTGVNAVGREAVDGFGDVFDCAGRGGWVFSSALYGWSCAFGWEGGGDVTVGELRADLGSCEVQFRDVEEDGGVGEDQSDVE